VNARRCLLVTTKWGYLGKTSRHRTPIGVPLACCLPICAGQRLLTFEAEVSRERVPLRNAYKAAGQVAVMRINGGEKHTLPVSAAGISQSPFSAMRPGAVQAAGSAPCRCLAAPLNALCLASYG
jgi:hypothetical protein